MEIMYVHLVQSTNPFLNLALENQLLMELAPNERHLVIYKNDPCVVMGRFQNPWLECNLLEMERNSIHLVRRQSGGGTVYHDHGNLNFCFINWKDQHDKNINNQILCEALKQLGVKAFPSGRSDILCEYNGESRKISGSAFKQKRDRAFHHGTMLLNANLENLTKFLIPSLTELETKATASVRSKVANLSEFGVTEEAYKECLIGAFEGFYRSSTKIITWDVELIQKKFGVMPYLEEIQQAQWIWNETPKFSLKGKGYHLTVHKGRVTDLLYERDIHPSFINEMLNLFADELFYRNELLKIREALSKYPMYKTEVDELFEDLFSKFYLP